MAFPTNGTKLANLFNPQVVGDLIQKKLVDAIKLAPLCTVDYSLSGQPGSKLTLPTFAYIGDGEELEEAADVTIAQLSASTVEVTIKKIGKAVQITEEAILSGHGNPVEEAVNQIILSIASKVEGNILAVLEAVGSDMTQTGGLTAENIGDALVKFGEDIDGEKVLLVSPETYNALRKSGDWCPASEIAARIIVEGALGMIHGCQVVVSNRVTNAYIVKPGALRLLIKRDTMVKTDEDIINDSVVLKANKYCAAYLYDSSKAIKVTA